MLSQGPTPDPKSELIITSFLTLPHPLHCPICGKDMVTVLLLQLMGGWEGLGWFIYVRVWVEGHGVGIFFLFFVLFLCFC